MRASEREIGGTESTRYAVQLINALIQDPAKELEDLIPRNHIRAPGSKAASASFPSTMGTTGGSATGPKPLSSLVTSSGVSFQPSLSTSSSSSQAGGKIGKGLPSNVRQPFPVSLPLAYAHPQLALLAAQTMHHIRHPRLPMAQFGGTFSPAASTWGPFPVRPVSPGSANSSPKHNGGANNTGGQAKPTSAHSEHISTASSGTPVTTTNTMTTSVPNTSAAASSPHTPTPTPYNPQSSIPTPSSVRKQLFAPDPKPAGVTPISNAAATSVSNAVRGTGSPAHPTSTTTTPNASQQQVGPISQPPIQPTKTEPVPVTPAGKDKPPAPENQTTSVSESINSVGFTSPALALGTKQEPRQQLPPPASSVPSTEAHPPLHNSQPSSCLPPGTSPAHSHNVAHPNNTVPHFSAPAPRVSHRMQPPGPYYSPPEQQQSQHQQQQSVFVPFSAQQELPKQSQSQTSQPTNLHSQPQTQGQAPGSLQVSANLGIMNGSQMQHIVAVASPPQPKPGSSSQQDRKVPPPIGTERLARIRQTGSVNPPLLTTSYTASVGQGGIWSFGVGSASEAMSGWSQPLMSSHMMHPQLQAEQSAFSQHQPMEQDDTGIANPANSYHQPQHLPNNYMDFQKVKHKCDCADNFPLISPLCACVRPITRFLSV
ncbi:hypothetical protein XENOCAPTIV_003796 [Xenoophorus captivus]|uniref:Uncharacterized protein n=1 Tax=Xenoophorus captivus TaxID=1517983 RepID=A0ABV0QCM4_9TELE